MFQTNSVIANAQTPNKSNTFLQIHSLEQTTSEKLNSFYQIGSTTTRPEYKGLDIRTGPTMPATPEGKWAALPLGFAGLFIMSIIFMVIYRSRQSKTMKN